MDGPVFIDFSFDRGKKLPFGTIVRLPLDKSHLNKENLDIKQHLIRIIIINIEAYFDLPN